MPFLTTIEGTYGFGRGAQRSDVSGVPFQILNTLATSLRNNMADFRNPSFYNYWCAGDGYDADDFPKRVVHCDLRRLRVRFLVLSFELHHHGAVLRASSAPRHDGLDG